ncbi:hypothetical protein DEO72_LG5g837 [Vigna unguiculata]|uniref:Uncharacterized protein n=1 Tax=Vigna unguiculata TaxID=3917 RepID=A0A4D6LWN0_VIGUN|nr:hypothetical protein DEO72_LG5g837 [Vigna unguiculata]
MGKGTNTLMLHHESQPNGHELELMRESNLMEANTMIMMYRDDVKIKWYVERWKNERKVMLNEGHEVGCKIYDSALRREKWVRHFYVFQVFSFRVSWESPTGAR